MGEERPDESGENERNGENFGAGGRIHPKGGARGRRGILVGLLVSGDTKFCRRGTAACYGHAARSAAGDREDRRGASICDARCLSAPWYPAVVRTIRRNPCGVQLPRMEV